MKPTRRIKMFAALAVCAVALPFHAPAADPSDTYHYNGPEGLPSFTASINGKELPPPEPKFGGVINETAKDSKPWWPARVVPPKGAPNVRLIICCNSNDAAQANDTTT